MELSSSALRTLSPVLVEKTVASPLMPAAAREQYQKLATSLHHAQAAREIRTLVVSSSVIGEGKSLTATNLALTLSQSFRKRVLLIDADVRRPTIHTAFQVPLSPGLSEALGPGGLPARPVAISSTLAVLPAGTTHDPIGTLSSESLSAVLEAGAQSFDWVVIDTPPVGLLSDAKLVAARVDAVLLVVSAGSAPLALVQGAVEAFGRDRIVGVVLNRADDRVVSSGYYGHYAEYYSRPPRP